MNELKEVRIRLVPGNTLYSGRSISTPEDAVAVMAGELAQLDRECVCVVNLDVKNRPLNFSIVSIGTLNNSLVGIGDVFKAAILTGKTNSIIMLHNHPSGDPTPSRLDEEITEKVAAAGKLMDIDLVDHIIVSSTGLIYSFSTEQPDRFRFNPHIVLDRVCEEATAYSRKEKIQRITAKLKDGVTAYFNSDRYHELLGFMRHFHNYSFNNTLLIAMQKPDATLVAGYTTWKNQGRYVRAGEHGIKILSPVPVKAKDNGLTDAEKETHLYFRPVTVFDVSQTEGRPLPDLGPKELQGDITGYWDLISALTTVSKVPITYQHIDSGAKGFYRREPAEIVVERDMSEMQTVKTLIHEISHSRLHSQEHMQGTEVKDQRTREVEAESIAFTVCQHFGIDTSEYSFDYIGSWSSGKDLKELSASMETIRHTSEELIDEAECELNRIRQADRYEIYQIDHDGPKRDQLFMSSDELQKQGQDITADGYRCVYTGLLLTGITLDAIFEKLNMDPPEGFRGHSLSVSDVIVTHLGGNEKAFFVDSFGFKEVPDFQKNMPVIQPKAISRKAI